MSITVLASGIDTMEASYPGTVSDTFLGELEVLRSRAQELDTPQPYPIEDFDFSVQPHGLKAFRYLLTCPEAHVRIARGERLPSAFIRLSAYGLALHGARPLYDALTLGLADALGLSGSRLSRLDVAIDFQGFAPTDLAGTRFICPAEFRPIYPNAEKPETYQFGKGNIVVRLYNKTREIVVSGKTWVRAGWEVNPAYDPSLDVWRLEVQLRRQALRELGCPTPEDAFERLDELTSHGLSWCDLRTIGPGSSDTWERHPIWRTLAETVCGNAPPLLRTVHQSKLSGFERSANAILGYCVSAGARLNLTDFDMLWPVIEEAVRVRMGSPEEFAAACDRRRRQRLI